MKLPYSDIEMKFKFRLLTYLSMQLQPLIGIKELLVLVKRFFPVFFSQDFEKHHP